jgi:integrase
VLAESSGPIMANRVRAATSTLFSWSMKQGLAEVNPVVGTAPPAAENKRDRVLSEEEVRFVWHALEACAPDYRDIVHLLLLLGQRASEVAGMRWSEVDLERALWTLPAPRTKNGLMHEVPLPSQGVAILQSRRLGRDPDRDLVFGRRAGPFSGWSVAKEKLDLQLTLHRAEQRLGRKLKVDEKPLAVDALAAWTIHDIRRTTITGMNEIGIEPHIVEAIVNHISGAKAGVAGIYNHAKYRFQKKTALQRWADHMDQFIANK